MISFTNVCKTGDALLATAITSSTVVRFILDGGKQTLDTIDNTRTSISACLAVITSGMVDIPTKSPPIFRKKLYSAGVSRDGP